MARPLQLFRWGGSGILVAVCLILVLQAGASRMLNIQERDSPIPGLHQLPMQLGNWNAIGEGSLESAVTEYLKPDEYILRDYVAKNGAAPISLFAAYFKSLQNTYGPHSPRVCLPGSGWLERSSSIESVQVPGRATGIPVNEYVMEKAGDRILVLYWYQNDRNIWAEEFQAKLRLLPDLIRYKRSDASLIRLVTPIQGTSAGKELADCTEFTRLLFPELVERFGTAR